MIYINNLRKEIGIRTLFEIDKLTISEDDRIGLIGDNGAGKTTFLKILLGEDLDYSGDVDIQTIICSLMNDKKEDKALNESYSDLGLDSKEQYSPGQTQRLKLDKLISNKSAFLLLDEPTSHLDIKQKEKLAESLENRYKGYIIISHDRDFINKTCNKIFELSHGELEIFNGDYFFYLEERIRRKKFAQREYEDYISEKKRLTGLKSDIRTKSSKVRTTPKRMGN